MRLVGTFRERSLTDRADGADRSTGRYGEPHLLLLLDLNGFKAYNDTFGHLAGDPLLQRLGRRLQRALGGRGDALRPRGDEFCRLRPEDTRTCPGSRQPS